MFSHIIASAALDAVERGVKPGQPVYMLNLLRFRESAHYAAGFDAPPCSGREAYYERYIPAFRRIAAGRLGPRVFLGASIAGLVAPQGERWDIAAVNEYPDFALFRAIVDTDEYRVVAEPHRLAALEDFRLLAFDKAL